MEHIWITEVSLGRTKSAKKLVKGRGALLVHLQAQAAADGARGLRIELREGSEMPLLGCQVRQQHAEKSAVCYCTTFCVSAFIGSLSIRSASHGKP